jgi:succinate dehydrogenase / fumarate reductase, flavoprotein subunit
MGGVRVDTELETAVPGLFVCGEAVGGANGANRLSGNAITEAFVFGARAGRNAARRAALTLSAWSSDAAQPTRDLLLDAGSAQRPNPAALIAELQALMADLVGPFRTEDKLRRGIAGLAALQQQVGEGPWGSASGYDAALLDWLDLRNMLLVAQSVALPALARTESRGAHQREDHPGLDEAWTLNQMITLADGELRLTRSAAPSGKAAA